MAGDRAFAGIAKTGFDPALFQINSAGRTALTMRMDCMYYSGRAVSARYDMVGAVAFEGFSLSLMRCSIVPLLEVSFTSAIVALLFFIVGSKT